MQCCSFNDLDADRGSSRGGSLRPAAGREFADFPFHRARVVASPAGHDSALKDLVEHGLMKFLRDLRGEMRRRS